MSAVSMISVPMLVIMFILGCIGNILIIIFFLKYPQSRRMKAKKRPAYTLFLVHLAIADLIACFIVPIYYIPQELNNGRWFFGEFLCEYTIFIATGVTMYTSCWILFGIIYERYRKVVHPFKKRMKSKHIHLFCFVAWVLSFLLHIPYFMATQLKENDDGVLVCTSSLITAMHRDVVVSYYVLRLVFQSMLPIIIMFYYYLQIHKAIDSSRKMNTANNVSKLRVQKQTRLIIVAVKRALMIFSFTIIMNNCAHVTRAVITLYYPETWEKLVPLQLFVDFFIRFLAVNNFINCIIYAGNMTNFRRFVFRVLCPCRKTSNVAEFDNISKGNKETNTTKLSDEEQHHPQNKKAVHETPH